ncbi:MAG: glycosyltransferase family 2 protein [Sedimentisphaerales bacterium]|nr:glycosyltransferase family 2 protein [Sedimentisphaerales bacterium]
MIPISVVVPVFNEIKNIAACLENLQDFSEVIVVDSGSNDGTVQAAEQFSNVRVVNFCWNGKYPKKRNWILKNHSFNNEWVLFVDADEFLTDSFRQELKDTIARTDCNGFWLNFDNYFMGKQLRFGDKFRKIALLRLGFGQYEYTGEVRWSQLPIEVHEPLIVEGKVGVINAPIIHNDGKGLSAYIEKHNDYSSWEAGLFYSVRKNRKIWNSLTFRRKLKYRLLNSPFAGLFYFIYSYIFKFGFMDGKVGFMFAVVKMTYYFQVYCKIKEKEHINDIA